MSPRFRSGRDTDGELPQEEFTIDTGEDTLVQQHMRDEVDVNTIVRRFGVTGAMPFGREAGVYGDFTEIQDFDGAVAKVEGARSRFMTLPAEVRERFDNDPGKMIAFAQSVSEEQFRDELGRFAAPPVEASSGDAVS